MAQASLRAEDDPALDEVFETLSNQDCRELIQAMDQPRTAAELSERSDVPLSTTYRKIEQLADAGLVDDVIEIREDGRHTSRYYPNFVTIEVNLAEDRTMHIDITRPPSTADERLADLWSEVRKEV